MDTTLILALAAEVGEPAGAATFWGTDIGGFIKAILGAVGVVIVLAGLFKGIPKGLNGKMADAAKIILGAVVLAVLCFKPELISTMITVAGDIFTKVLDSIQSFSK